MKPVALWLFGILLFAPAAYSQDYYAECISIDGFYPSGETIRINASGEILLSTATRILKRDKTGEPIWDVAISGIIYDAWLDDGGNVYVLTYNFSTSVYQLLKYNSDGTSGWIPKTLGTTGYSGTIDKQGNVYLTRYVANGVLFDLQVLKYSSSGAPVWQKQFAHNIAEYSGTDITVNDNGETFITAAIAGGSLQEFVKLNSSGNITWTEIVDVPVRTDRSVHLDSDGNLLGVLSGTNFNSYSDETYLFKIHTKGGIIDSNVLDISTTNVFLKGGNLYLTGTFSERARVISLTYTNLSVIINFDLTDTDVIAGSVRVDNDGFIYVNGAWIDLNSGKPYGFVAKYSSKGEPIWRYDPSVEGGNIEFDIENNILAPFNFCLVKIYQCDNTSPSLTDEPIDKNVCAGTDATFHVGASGKKLFYHWKKGTELLENSSKFSGTNTATLTVKAATSADAGLYSCTIVDGCGGTLNSRQATLSIIATPSITLQPKDVSGCPASAAIFKIAVTGGQNVTYQWKKGNQVLISTPGVTGTQTNTLTITSLSATDAGDYYCEVSGACLSTPLVSQKAVLSVNAPTTISKQPESITTCTGKSITFSVTASGTSISYQWKKGTSNLSESARITGTKSNTLTLQTLQNSDAGDYICEVTGACGGKVTSSKAVLIVTNEGEITVNPQNKSVCAGSNTSFSITTTGNGITLQWYKGNTALSNNAKYSGVTTATLGLVAVGAADQGAYACVVTGACGTKITSSAAQLTIGAAALVASKSADLNLCSEEPAKFSITTSGVVASYQWKKNNTALKDDSSISGSNTAALLLGSVTLADAGNYTCEITPTCGAKQTSGVIKLTIKEQVEITEEPGDLQVCETEDFELTVKSKGSVSSYQWKKNGIDLINGVDITGAKTDKLQIVSSTLANEGLYTCEITGCGGKVVTAGVKIGVNPKPNLEAVSPIDCQDFIPEWSSLIRDLRNTSGTYHLFLNGSPEALDISEIKGHGVYIIVKESEFCADTVTWNNDCVITGVVEKSFSEITISPNPTERWIHFQYPIGATKKYHVYNSNGMLIESGDLDPGGEIVVDGEQWASGVYMLMYHDTEGKSILKRFVLQR